MEEEREAAPRLQVLAQLHLQREPMGGRGGGWEPKIGRGGGDKTQEPHWWGMGGEKSGSPK